MDQPPAEKLREVLAQGHWDQAVGLLQRLDPAAAANLFLGVPFEEQRVLFRVLPVDFAATLIGHFPYYHAYVLLHTRSTEGLRAIVNKMNPGDRIQFLDDLPGEAWQRLMDELSGEYTPAAQPEEGAAA